MKRLCESIKYERFNFLKKKIFLNSFPRASAGPWIPHPTTAKAVDCWSLSELSFNLHVILIMPIVSRIGSLNYCRAGSPPPYGVRPTDMERGMAQPNQLHTDHVVDSAKHKPCL